MVEWLRFYNDDEGKQLLLPIARWQLSTSKKILAKNPKETHTQREIFELS